MLEELEIKEMIAPFEDTRVNGFRPENYLIQNDGCDNFLIHREVTKDEEKELKKEAIFEYKGKMYLASIANCPSEEHAIIAVNSYWYAIKQINECLLNERNKAGKISSAYSLFSSK